jgi:hypothetical protein
MKKRLVIAIALVALCAPAVFAREQTVLARVTVYWRAENQSRASWNGARLRTGHCAVDPRRIPYGSKVVFSDGVECRAVDTGPAVVSRQAARLSGRNAAQRDALVVDRFFETKEEALAWADAHSHFMTLKVLMPGYDRDESHRRALLARAAAQSTSSTHLPAVHIPSGLQTFDATALALLPFVPIFRRMRRRIGLQPCYA